MPPDPWNDALRMVLCGLAVLAGAVPVGLFAWVLARRAGEPVLPRPRPWRVPWTGLEVLLLFPFSLLSAGAFVSPVLTGSRFYSVVYGNKNADELWRGVSLLWSQVIFVPLWLVLLVSVRNTLYPKMSSRPVRPAVSVTLGVAGWVVIHLVVAALHFLVTSVFALLEWSTDEHPLVKIFRLGRPIIDYGLLEVQAAIAVPVLEEVLFRGVLLPWALSRRYRVKLLLVVTLVLAPVMSLNRVAGGDAYLLMGPVLFAACLATGWAVLQRVIKRKRRTAGAVYASAALFAVVHSSVWPSPIPLFVLGLGLGWLAIRTRGVLAPVIVHGLFNTVSVLFVLSGGSS